MSTRDMFFRDPRDEFREPWDGCQNKLIIGFGFQIQSHWVQNRLIINLWQQCIEGDREFKTKGIIGGGEMGLPVLPELSSN